MQCETLLGFLPREIKLLLIEFLPKEHLLVESFLFDMKTVVTCEQKEASIKTLCTYSAGIGHMPLLKWSRREGCPWDEITCSRAAGNGHLEVLKWLRSPDKPEGQCPWDEITCSRAAENGHLEVLKWVRSPDKPEGQCPWNKWTCSRAAGNGHLEVLKWVRLPDKPEGQCPWDEMDM